MDGVTLTGSRGPAVIQNPETASAVRQGQPPASTSQASSTGTPVLPAPGDSARDSASATDEKRSAVEKVLKAIDDAGNDIASGARLVIRMDEDSGRFVYEFRDPRSDEVVRQFPAESVLKALAAYRQAAAGVVLDQQA